LTPSKERQLHQYTDYITSIHIIYIGEEREEEDQGYIPRVRLIIIIAIITIISCRLK